MYQQAWAQRAAKPLVRRNIESDLSCAAESPAAACPSSASFSRNFCREPRILSSGGKRRRELDDAVIEERRSHFDRVRHAHAIGLHQDVVGQVVLLIEPQIRTQIAREHEPLATRENGIERARKLRRSRTLFSSSEKVPFQYTCARAGVIRRAFQQPLQLVFQADLLVGDRPVAAAPRAKPHDGTAAISAGLARTRSRDRSGSRQTVRQRLHRSARP